MAHPVKTQLPVQSPVVDARGRWALLLTTASPRAAALYREAIERVHGAEAGADRLLDEAIACDPTFAVAHAARWMLAHADGERDIACAARDAAMTCREGASAWERGHVECLAALITRQPDAWTRAREHLAAHPGDLLLASQLIGDLFFYGREGKREAVMDVLREIEPHHRDDWAFQARFGFHMSELGDPLSAIPILQAALAARPRAPFVAHALAHALLESGQRAASHRFLHYWVARHDPAGPIDGHIHWHLSLGEMESAQPAAAVERYVGSTAPDASHCALGLRLADAGGLFCRMALDGAPLDGMPRARLHELLGTLKGALRIPFVAVHAAALALVLDEPDVLDRCVEEMARHARESGDDAEYRVVLAFGHYLSGDLPACVEALERDRSNVWEAIGGSNEERALIAQLYARASGRPTSQESVKTTFPTRASGLRRTALRASIVLLCAAGMGSPADGWAQSAMGSPTASLRDLAPDVDRDTGSCGDTPPPAPRVTRPSPVARPSVARPSPAALFACGDTPAGALR